MQDDLLAYKRYHDAMKDKYLIDHSLAFNYSGSKSQIIKIRDQDFIFIESVIFNHPNYPTVKFKNEIHNS